MSNNKDFKVKNGIQPTVYQESLGTVVSAVEGYSLSSASYDSKSFATTTEENAPHGISVKPDGTKLFVLGNGGDDVGEYTLSTPYDISTASFVDSFSVATQLSLPRGLFFKPDGTKFYAVGTSTDKVFQYSMTTAWDVSTASYESKEFSVGTQETSPYGLSFKTDGTKMYILGMGANSVLQYTLSTAWDVSTASYDSVSYSVSSLGTLAVCVVFNDTGTEMYTTSAVNGGFVRIHTLTTAWEVSTASHTGSLDTTGDMTASQIGGLVFADSGKKMYFSQQANDTIYQYSTVLATNSLDLSTGSVFEVTPTSDIQVNLSNPAASGTVSQGTLLLRLPRYDVSNASYDSVNFSFATQDGVPLGFAFKPDGTKLYIAGNQNDRIYQYSLSTAFDISTMTYDNVSKYVGSEELFLAGVRFNNDGTKMYVVGYNTDEVEEYNLSTAWNVSTATYNSVNFSISDTNPREVIFNSDGSKMYVLGDGNLSIYQYSLSTNFDLSTASYNNVSLSVSAQSTEPTSMAFNSDGTKLFLLDRETVLPPNAGAVYQYTLSTAYDLSTASYDSVSFSVASQDANAYGIGFDSDGSKMYVLGYNTDLIYQYTIGSGVESTITYDSTIQFGGGTAPDSPLANETDVITFSTRDGGTTYQAAQAIDGAV